MKILVRLPNWLGDMVMAVGFINQLPHYFPDAEISVIAKKGIHDLLPYFPPTHHQFVFSKQEYKGIRGLIRFGRMIGRTEKFDLYFSLPDSFSTALMGFFSGARRRIGYKKEGRQFLLTKSYQKPGDLHRVEEYIKLLEYYTGLPPAPVAVRLLHDFKKQDYLVININSEASSRRLPAGKAVEIINAVREHTSLPVKLIGAPKEREFVASVISKLADTTQVENLAGQTSLSGLVEILACALAVLSTDSGPAHLANSLGTNTVVMFGAGKESNTAPYDVLNRSVIRLGRLSCEPCQKNICHRFTIPQCLEQLDRKILVDTLLKSVTGNNITT